MRATDTANSTLFCSECKAPIPAVEVWPGRRLVQCGKSECRLSAQSRAPMYQYVFHETTVCGGIGCTNFVPEGTYDSRAAFKVCSDACFRKRRSKGWIWYECSHCNAPCLGRPWSTRHFCSSEHQSLFVINEALKKCERFAPTIEEYLAGWAKIHYRNTKTVRASLLAFCEFLIHKEVLSLDDVDPRVITQYLAWGVDVGRRQVAHSTSALATFFHWMIAEGRRTAPNPVVPAMHYPSQPQRKPRPLNRAEIDRAWEILSSRGTNLLRLAFAIGIEGGLRIGEIVNVRITDIDELRQTIFIRLPNKAMKERITFFHTKTQQHLKAWLQERSKECDHDYLFHNKWNRPATTDMLRRQFKELFCDPNQDLRFDKWSTHALRHTLATGLANAGGKVATIAAIGGWSSLTTMLGYIDADNDVARDGYLEAVQVNNKKKYQPPASEMSLDHYLTLPADAEDTPTAN